MKKAVILLSGGLDSATTLAIAKEADFVPYCLSFDYGQRHSVELTMAAKQAQLQGAAEHKVAKIDLRIFGGSALTDNINVPKHDSVDEMQKDIPITYVPARNTIFLSYALAYAEVIGAMDIFMGVNAVDYSGYPDCRPEFIEAYERMANLALAATTEGKQRFRIHTPLIRLTKAEIIRQGLALGVDYEQTISCYDPVGEQACGHCDSCLLRLKGFSELGRKDLVRYHV